MKYKIWDKKSNLVTPIGEVLTPEQVFERYPAARIDGIDYIIADSLISMSVFMEYEATKEHYKKLGANITDTMTKQEVLDTISYFEENPPAPPPSEQERIAAALEFLALNNLPDQTV